MSKNKKTISEILNEPVVPVEAPVDPVEAPVDPTPIDSTENVVSIENVSVNAAVVKNGKNIVRKYSLEIHGENFLSLAKEFADKNKFQTEFVEE